MTTTPERMTIYLDHAASTPASPAVIERMADVMAHSGANPASLHRAGRRAARVVDDAAGEMAGLIGAQPEEIVWTSGATEAINLALKGVAEFNTRRGHIVSVVTEHRATLDALAWLEKRGLRVTRLEVDSDGRIDLGALDAAIGDDTLCVSIMHVNNETGVVQDIADIGALCAARGVTLHVDAAQSLGKLAIDVSTIPAGLVSMSAHKLGGPPGVGALYVRRAPRVGLAAQIHGGGQQGNRRSGTLAAHQIAGFGAACAQGRATRDAEQARLAALTEQLWRRLSTLDGVLRNGHVGHRAPHILNVSVAGVHGAALLMGLTEGGPALAVSSGAACSAAKAESSYVLRAMGCAPRLAAASVRFSLGRTNTPDDVEAAASRTIAEITRLRALAPRGLALPV